jgi:hypothetical protein
MKYLIIVALIGIAIAGTLLNVHIIRLNEGFEVIAKDNMTFRDTYADVRAWGLADYMSHAPRIRNYLFYEKKYAALKNMVNQKKAAVNKETGSVADSAKKQLESAEKAIRDWLK